MLWQPSFEPQRPTPRGEVAMTIAARSGSLTCNYVLTSHHDLGRWRS
jgi:hypothetical protein